MAMAMSINIDSSHDANKTMAQANADASWPVHALYSVRVAASHCLLRSVDVAIDMAMPRAGPAAVRCGAVSGSGQKLNAGQAQLWQWRWCCAPALIGTAPLVPVMGSGGRGGGGR